MVGGAGSGAPARDRGDWARHGHAVDAEVAEVVLRRLYTTGDIAGRLGVSRQRARIVARQRDFPDSFDDLRSGSVWLVEDVEAWIRAHRSHPGRQSARR